jgi:MFS transporter, DHA1 family, multidrug resistance protein
MFGVLAAFGLVLLLAGMFGLPETLPADKRLRGGLSETLRGFRVLSGDRLFVGAAASAGLAFASMFAYIAGATFVLQEIYGLSPQWFSLVFGVNSIGIVAAGQVGGRLIHRLSPATVLGIGLGQNLLGAGCLAASALLGLGLPMIIGSLFVMVSAVGLIFPTATALAMADYPDRAGAASSLLGLGQFFAGAVAAPLVGIGGRATALPMGVVAASSSLSAMLVFVILVVPVIRTRRVDTRDELPPTNAI